jgi:hypothetical protein
VAVTIRFVTVSTDTQPFPNLRSHESEVADLTDNEFPEWRSSALPPRDLVGNRGNNRFGEVSIRCDQTGQA